MEKKSFIFYTSWKKNVEMMEDDELRRFINNLINHTEGKEVELPTRVEKMVWNDLVEVLNHNERKRERAAERSRQNGQRGGRPTKPNETQNNPTGFNETQQVNQEPDGLNHNLNNLLMGNGEWSIVNGEGEKVIGKGLKGNGEWKNEKLKMIMKQLIDEGRITEEEVEQMSVSKTRAILNDIFKDYQNWEADLNRMGDTLFIQSLGNKFGENTYIVAATIKSLFIL